MSSESDDDNLPFDVLEAARSAVSSLIPEKSSRQYESVYNDFMKWCGFKKLKNVSESVLAYLEYKAKKLRPPTLWSIYSMLNKTLNVKQNVDIAKFPKLIPYLKNRNIGYRPKKSKVLTKTEIEKFIEEAPDQSFLLLKTILIIGIHGACRRIEMLNLTINDIEDTGSVVNIKIEDSKTHSQRPFVISNPSHIELYRKYHGLRPAYCTNPRFFIKYANGKCANQVIGINNIRNTPKESDSSTTGIGDFHQDKTLVVNQPTSSMEMGIQKETISLNQLASSSGITLNNCTITNLHLNIAQDK